METSKIVTLIAFVVLIVALVVVFAFPTTEPSLAPPDKKSCVWVDGFFNPVEETEVLGGIDCTFKKDNYDSFKVGSIAYTVSGISSSNTDTCVDGNLMNEYWCDSGVAQRTLGFCTLGCKNSGQGGGCFNRVRVCGASAPPEETTDTPVSMGYLSR